VTDEGGTSPFWEAVGRKFFGRDFFDIEKISGGRSATFIAEVMPSYPLYVPLLPEAAQRVLGEPNARSLLAYDIHVEEGFEPDRFVDIFDAGPVLTAHVDRSACVTDNETRVVRELAQPRPAAGADGTTRYLISSNRPGEFRCISAELPADESEGAPLSSAARAALDVVHGDPVRCVPLYRRHARKAEEADDDSGGYRAHADARRSLHCASDIRGARR
jgi:arginine N-succinyltransferase